MNASTAINMFIKAVLREGKLPFSIGFDKPNDVTLAAIKEADEMDKNPDNCRTFTSIEEIIIPQDSKTSHLDTSCALQSM